jgi:[ribosomal protein S18]-alanine N-acetyltransferase
VVELELDSFPHDAWTADYLTYAVDGEMPTTRLLVAEVDGVVVAHAIVSIVFEVAELQRIGVTPDRRRQGIAGALLGGVVALASGEGAERMLLEVREENAGALAFYERAGFTEIDRRPRYYRDGAAAIVMELPLEDQGR